MKIFNNTINYEGEKAIAVFSKYEHYVDMVSGLLESIATYDVLTESGKIFTGIHENDIEE